MRIIALFPEYSHINLLYKKVKHLVGFYQHHVFFCTNVKESGKQCCGPGNGETTASEFRDYMKKALKKRELHGTGLYRVSTSGCLGRCSEGPLLVIYPEGIWYSYKTHQDIDEIINEHLLKGIPVKRLLLEP